MKRLRDYSLIRSSGELGRPLWTDEKLQQMNEQFTAAIREAVEAGREHCPTAVSTRPGTRFPIVGYERPD
jgi:hypothetical protein